jgi:purine-nucleoside phosphorylase
MGRAASIRRHWFGADSTDAVAPNVLLTERDRLEQYRAAMDWTTGRFEGVFRGITGTLDGWPLSVIHSLGPAHIADCVEFLAAGFDVRQLMSTGSIGGLDTEIGDVVVSNSCTTMDAYSLACYDQEVHEERGIGKVVRVDAATYPPDIPVELRSGLAQDFGSVIHSGRIFTVPAVSWETDATLESLQQRGFVGVDLESGPFLAACRRTGANGLCIHWVTDLPLRRSFYHRYEGDPRVAVADERKKHTQWLNLPKLILPIVTQALALNAAAQDGIAGGAPQ